jgi:uncharacterized protein
MSVAILGFLVGLVMGMVGGGGAVIAVPLLVYGVGLGVQEATTASLAVVGAAASTGAVGQARRGAVCWTSAAWFSAAAAVGGLIGAFGNRALGGATLLLAFSLVMLAAAKWTWERSSTAAAGSHGCPKATPRLLAPLGLLVGGLTGLVGVGGGFLIVPALVAGIGFGLREAMGTSMAIVAAVSALALAAHLATGSRLDLPVVATMGGTAILGAALGPRLGDHVSAPLLGRAFAVLVVLVAVGISAATIEGVGI